MLNLPFGIVFLLVARLRTRAVDPAGVDEDLLEEALAVRMALADPTEDDRLERKVPRAKERARAALAELLGALVALAVAHAADLLLLRPARRRVLSADGPQAGAHLFGAEWSALALQNLLTPEGRLASLVVERLLGPRRILRLFGARRRPDRRRPDREQRATTLTLATRDESPRPVDGPPVPRAKVVLSVRLDDATGTRLVWCVNRYRRTPSSSGHGERWSSVRREETAAAANLACIAFFAERPTDEPPTPARPRQEARPVAAGA